MSKENLKKSNKFVTAPVSDLAIISKEDMISVQQLENCIKMISFFTIASEEHVKDDVKFLTSHFHECLETELMDDIDERKRMLNIIRQTQELRKLTKGLNPQAVVDSLGFLVAMKKAVVASNPKRHGNE